MNQDRTEQVNAAPDRAALDALARAQARGALLGITGALIAVPSAAAFQLIVQQVGYPAKDAQSQVN